MPSTVELCGLDRRTVSACPLGAGRGCFDDSTSLNVSLKFRPGGEPIVGLVQHGPARNDRFDPTVVGLDHLAFRVGSRQELATWAARLDERGVAHSGPIDVPPGAILNFKDPDGIALACFWDRPTEKES